MRILNFPLIVPCFTIFFLNVCASESNLVFEHPQAQFGYQQWFTGALLTPNATTVPTAHPGLELILAASENYGYYDSDWKIKHTPSMWEIAPYFDFQASFNRVVGIELIGSMTTNFSQGASSTHLQDTIFRLGFQVSNDQADSWIPDFRILIQEIFPTGKYQKLNSKKYGTDSTGEGSFQTGAHIVFQKLFNNQGKHPFTLRADFGYSIPAPVSVRGLNSFGGISITKGKVYPGKWLTSFLFGQVSLTRKCALALELNYLHAEKGRFSGQQGANINVACVDELSAIPEIQYTVTENMGFIFGTWGTLAGKNANAFRGVVGAVLFLF